MELGHRAGRTGEQGRSDGGHSMQTQGLQRNSPGAAGTTPSSPSALPWLPDPWCDPDLLGHSLKTEGKRVKEYPCPSLTLPLSRGGARLMGGC